MKVDKATVSIDISVSEWEKKVVSLLAEGYTIPDIEPEIKDDSRAIEYKLSKLKIRLNCRTAAHLVSFFIRNKLID